MPNRTPAELSLRDSFVARFGAKAKKLQVSEKHSGGFKLILGVQSCDIPKRSSVYDRKYLESFFPKPGALSPRDASYAAKHQQAEALCCERAEAFVEASGLLQLDPKLSYVLKRSKHQHWLVLTFKGATCRFGMDSWYHQGKAALDSCLIQKQAYAQVRYGIGAKTLAFTDREWRERIAQASGGQVVPEGYFIPVTGRIATKFGPNRFQCLNCKSVFTARRVSSSKNWILRCKECNSNKSRNASKLSAAWLLDVETRQSITLQRAASPEGEKRITLPSGAATHVDGYHKASRTVFEFHGSRWHGNPHIFYPDETPSPYSKKTAAQLLQATIEREEQILFAGYNLVRIWDTDFLDQERYNQWLLRNSSRLPRSSTRR